MKAERLAIANIAALMDDRGYKQKDLAMWCHKTETWASQLLHHKRGLTLEMIDLIADFFGCTAHDLFQPGLSGISDRRKGERRSGKDRREGVGLRLMRRDILPSLEAARRRDV